MSWWSRVSDEADEEEVVSEVATSAFSSITDSIIDTHSAVVVLAITVAAELGAFAMFYVSKDKVQECLAESDFDVWLYAAAAVFLVGFFAAFAVYRLITDRWPHRQAGIFIWPVSISAGASNVLLFFALAAFELR